ncbi:hypothetical protein OEA41_006753 [Lepraria neglecta]|uniref:Uncharacterized protein n=1 Tax=Lepraria neglecta TaxID=209136 RepID=A0AAE0DKR8_9LECA|nr:hypothetical protein OEA41_006753 [Lepraria neglecta]
MYSAPQNQLEPDLEGQGQGLQVPERVMVRPERTQSTREPFTAVIKSNAGVKRSQPQSAATTRPSESQQKKGQVVFICGGDHDLTRWAIQVKVHAAAPLARRHGSKPEKPCTCENCDVVICQKLNRAFWAQVGPWHRYIPFYGIVKVEEVKFQIRSLREDRYGILLEHLDYKKIEEEANSQIDLAKSSQDYLTNDFCDPETNCHTEECLKMMDFANDPCFVKQAESAKLRLKGLKSLGFLTENFKAPLTAAEGSSLKGLAQESCIYNGR